MFDQGLFPWFDQHDYLVLENKIDLFLMSIHLLEWKSGLFKMENRWCDQRIFQMKLIIIILQAYKMARPQFTLAQRVFIVNVCRDTGSLYQT